MLKSLVLKISGIDKDRFDKLRRQIDQLQSERTSLARQVEDLKTKRKRFQEDIRDSLDELQRQALDIRNETPLQQFLVGSSRLIGQHEAGHLIYEVRVDGVKLPVRTKVEM
jgi:septal ring factor EnvC (AmiA/AmiB activator)